jgi:hypothetical protein
MFDVSLRQLICHNECSVNCFCCARVGSGEKREKKEKATEEEPGAKNGPEVTDKVTHFHFF